MTGRLFCLSTLLFATALPFRSEPAPERIGGRRHNTGLFRSMKSTLRVQ